MMRVAADLHIHTALSPCADDAMTPPAIVAAAMAAGLGMIAICDHNSAGNVAAVQAAARLMPGACAADASSAGHPHLSVVAGIEITTAEEAHLLGYFPDVQAAEAVGAQLAATLPACPTGAPSRFGNQLLLDAHGALVGRESRDLSFATTVGLEEAVALILEHGGLPVPAHVDRPSYSVTSQLGFVPDDPRYAALELACAGKGQAELAAWSQQAAPAPRGTSGCTLIFSSDAHFLEEIGRVRTELLVADATFQELAAALAERDGRRVGRDA